MFMYLEYCFVMFTLAHMFVDSMKHTNTDNCWISRPEAAGMMTLSVCVMILICLHSPQLVCLTMDVNHTLFQLEIRQINLAHLDQRAIGMLVAFPSSLELVLCIVVI